MKKIGKIAVALLTACFTFMLWSCGDYYADTEPEAPPSANDGSEIVNTDVNRKIVYTVDMSVTATDVTEQAALLSEKVRELGGYVEERNEIFEDGECISANITFRVPTDDLDAFVGSIESDTRVDSKSITSKDITTQYVDATARLESLVERKAQLEKILEDTTLTSGERIEVINEISEVNEKIKAAEILIRDYDSEVEYSKVKLYIQKGREPVNAALIALIPLIIFVVLPAAIIIPIVLITKKKKG